MNEILAFMAVLTLVGVVVIGTVSIAKDTDSSKVFKTSTSTTDKQLN